MQLGLLPLTLETFEPAKLFRIEQVSKRCWVAIAQPWKLPNSNSAIFLGQKAVAVVDAQSSPIAAAALISQIRTEITDLPIRYVFLTHHHLDHAHGASAHKGAIVVGSEITRNLLLKEDGWLCAYAAGRRSAVSQEDPLYSYYEFVDRALLRAGWQQAAAGDPFWAQYFRQHRDERLALPDLTFSGDASVDLGALVLRAKLLGPAHTAGDIVVQAESEGVIATGDLLQSLEPLFMEADLAAWPAALTAVERLDFEIVIPGHGSVQHGCATALQFRNYIIELRDRVADGVGRGQSLPQLQSELNVSTIRALSSGYGAQIQRERIALLGSNTSPLEEAVKENVAQVYRRVQLSRRDRTGPSE